MKNLQPPDLLKIAKSCFEFINPSLNNYGNFHQSLSETVKVKAGNNIQYNFDVELDKLIKSELESVSAKVFSEESGWYSTVENPEYKIVYDPFCNSSLASKSFREAALGISLFKADNTWISSLVLDYQTGLVGLVNAGSSTQFFQVQTGKSVTITKQSPAESLGQSWVVLTIESLEERKEVSKLLPILGQCKRLIVSSGHIYWLKLATGEINAYLDPIGGEHLYEMFAATIAQGAGCQVTDLDGFEFNPSKMLSIFESDRNFSYFPVGSSSKSLQNELLAVLK